MDRPGQENRRRYPGQADMLILRERQNLDLKDSSTKLVVRRVRLTMAKRLTELTRERREKKKRKEKKNRKKEESKAHEMRVPYPSVLSVNSVERPSCQV